MKFRWSFPQFKLFIIEIAGEHSRFGYARYFSYKNEKKFIFDENFLGENWEKTHRSMHVRCAFDVADIAPTSTGITYAVSLSISLSLLLLKYSESGLKTFSSPLSEGKKSRFHSFSSMMKMKMKMKMHLPTLFFRLPKLWWTLSGFFRAVCGDYLHENACMKCKSSLSAGDTTFISVLWINFHVVFLGFSSENFPFFCRFPSIVCSGTSLLAPFSIPTCQGLVFLEISSTFFKIFPQQSLRKPPQVAAKGCTRITFSITSDNKFLTRRQMSSHL